MTTKFELNLKTENLKAHYSVLMENVQIANHELTEKLGQKNILQNELDKLTQKLAEGRNELMLFLEKTKQEKQNIRESTERLLKREKEINNLEVATSNKLEKINKDIELKLSTINGKISKKNLEVVELKKFCTTVLSEVKKEVSTLESTKEEILKQRAIKSRLGGEINLLYSERDDLIKSFTKECKEKNDTLNQLVKTIEDARKKIESPLQFLQKREIELESKERNLNTLIRRFKIYYDKHFPDRELKI